MKWLRRLGWTCAVLIGLGALAYYPLIVHSPEPKQDFLLDLMRVRALADSLPGVKPAEIRYERILSMKSYEAMLMAGDAWRETSMPVYSYQVAFPERTLIVDTAIERSAVKPEAMVLEYDAAAWQRLLDAMERAEQIVVTHEHMDHIGGVAAHPRLAQIVKAVRLTTAQLANPSGMAPLTLPADAMQNHQPLAYDGMTAIAPGVVLIAAPGHTPGSQMVYVKQGDGRELIFLGDVSWRTRNIEHVRERPLFMTLLIGEDRQAVLGQFRALHALAKREPAIALVPGHDGPAVEKLAASGFLSAGFR